ncbi:unnamed protein product, partial [Scytosiphon promiscuus]
GGGGTATVASFATSGGESDSRWHQRTGSAGSSSREDAHERGRRRHSSFFGTVAGHSDGGQQDSGGRRAGPMFDLPLVKHGLLRGRIKGRCTLVLGASNSGSLLRLGSVGALSVGGVASVGGVGVSRSGKG